MNSPTFYRPGRLSIIDVSGQDAGTILHNLTTNDVVSLTTDSGCESFVTNVRGKTVGHVYVYRHPDFLRLIGAPSQSTPIAEHIDRYTIREDATARIRDDEFTPIIVTSELLSKLPEPPEPEDAPRHFVYSAGEHEIDGYTTSWLGPATTVLLIPDAQLGLVLASLADACTDGGGLAEFHASRTRALFPWFGIDIDESNLPQEADRDAVAISFDKGCYLGQETVARLDAMGQVQKKLVQWQIDGCVPEVGAKLVDAAGKTVGRLTSVVAEESGAGADERPAGRAIGYARRTHFDPGASASGVDSETGAAFTGAVI